MHLRRALALSLAVPLLLAGCTEEEPTPKIPNPTTSSATPTPEETETAEPESESPEDFIRRWISVNTDMQNTGNVAPYKDLSRKCKPCIRTANRVEQIYQDGGFLRTEGWILKKTIDMTGADGAPIYDLEIKSSPTEFKETARGEVERYAGGNIVMRVRLNSAAPWQVIQLTQVPS